MKPHPCLSRELAMLKFECIIGIDCGVNTGYAVWLRGTKQLYNVTTCTILKAMSMVKIAFDAQRTQLLVRVEDPRLATYGRQKDTYKAQGAGSVKRDAQIWEEFLKEHHIAHEFVRPNKKLTKLSDETFKKITGYQGSTSQHARDAAMLVFGF